MVYDFQDRHYNNVPWQQQLLQIRHRDANRQLVIQEPPPPQPLFPLHKLVHNIKAHSVHIITMEPQGEGFRKHSQWDIDVKYV